MNIEEKLHALQNELEDAKMELNRVRIFIFFTYSVNFCTFIISLEFKYSLKFFLDKIVFLNKSYANL